MINPFSKTYNSTELETFLFLSQIRYFSQLKNSELARFLSAIHIRNYRKDEVVFFRGDPSQALYLIKRGNIRLTIDIRDTFETISDLRKGEAFGENSLLENTQRIYTAIVSSEAAELWVIPQFAILEIYESQPVIKAKMVASLAEYYNENNLKLFKSYRTSMGFFNLQEMFSKENL
jgi:CRP/FNR family transcriptional regulator, cyclic AMP receptor protein